MKCGVIIGSSYRIEIQFRATSSKSASSHETFHPQVCRPGVSEIRTSPRSFLPLLCNKITTKKSSDTLVFIPKTPEIPKSTKICVNLCNLWAKTIHDIRFIRVIRGCKSVGKKKSSDTTLSATAPWIVRAGLFPFSSGRHGSLPLRVPPALQRFHGSMGY